jgi:hypothetical protein
MEHKLKAPLPVQMSSWIGEQPASKAIRQGPELNFKNLRPPQEEHCSRAVCQKRAVAIPPREAPAPS